MTAIFQSREMANAAAERLKTYAQPQRLMILSHLLDGEQIVADIERTTGIGQPALSQQLAELRRANLVTMRRAAKQVFYRLADDDVTVCVRAIEAMFGSGTDVPKALERVVMPAPSTAAEPSRPVAAAAFARVG
ncbi:ArsR family transcriptional regulator [Sphingomonas sp. AAP5]|uniref:ArsR/SmtB family transcription factor n=1 Tax=Sphingomonas sp. AAP5 TaxID=1523415 RepID=UPI0010574379|nr:metalloregulator ArsR/SmtB family transcription factor [Sphingomonas sp. AAP5]QBM75983.1 ArsR family transcriptional regulator [Sphingomonas sp. AAP5]